VAKRSNGGNQEPVTAGDVRSYSVEEVQQLIKQYSEQYAISADLPLRVANCESGYHYGSKNKSSSASGVFQFIRSTWLGTDSGQAGISPFDADANVKEGVKKISQGGISAWYASKSCWNK
jgi:Transglycosylase-like domain